MMTVSPNLNLSLPYTTLPQPLPQLAPPQPPTTHAPDPTQPTSHHSTLKLPPTQTEETY